MIKRILDWLYAQGYVNESNDKIIELGLQVWDIDEEKIM